MNAPDATAAATLAALFPPATPALLALADGTVFRGRAIGALGSTIGEVVFNTAMTGYQEILTDPSYAGQIVTLTYPHIGNAGVNAEDVESNRIFAAGLVIRDLPRVASSWRATGDLGDYLREQQRDRHRRHRHAQADAHPARKGRAERLHRRGGESGRRRRPTTPSPRPRAAPSMAGLDLAKVVSCTQRYEWSEGTWALDGGYRAAATPQVPRRRVRLRHQAQHPAHAGRARLQADRRAGADAGARRARAAARRRVPVERTRRSRAVRLRHRGDPRDRRQRHADVRHLPRPPVARAWRPARARSR